jgi:hypothetical protein
MEADCSEERKKRRIRQDLNKEENNKSSIDRTYVYFVVRDQSMLLVEDSVVAR